MLSISNGFLEIGAARIPNHEKPALMIYDVENNDARIYGFFRSELLADEFMENLADMVGAKWKEGAEDG